MHDGLIPTKDMRMATAVGVTFGQHLRAAREKRGLSQRKLAEKVGRSHTAIQNWENDVDLPEASIIPHLARNLRVRPSRIGAWLEDSPLRYDPTSGKRCFLSVVYDLANHLHVTQPHASHHAA